MNDHEERHLALAGLVLEATATLVELARIVSEQNQRIKALEALQVSFEDGMEPIEIRARDWATDEIVTVRPVTKAPPFVEQCRLHGLVRIDGRCRMCEPSVPALREEPRLSTRHAFAEMHEGEDPWSDGHDPETCGFPCPVHHAAIYFNIRDIA